MMRKELLLPPSCETRRCPKSDAGFVFRITRMRVLVALSVLCTRLTGIPFTPRGIVHLLHAQVGVFIALIPVEIPLLFRLFVAAWVVSSVYRSLRLD